MEIIAKIHTDLPDKFGVPRQSGLSKALTGRIVFEPKYRNPDAVRGLDDYSHIWLIWQFSKAAREEWSATVRPPRLGGNVRVGVFATRAPFRPNPIGLSCVKLEKIEHDEKLGCVLTVSGIDMIDGTPIYDIKPYLAYADSRPEARCGFAEKGLTHALKVQFPEELLAIIPAQAHSALIDMLALDPRPSYQNDAERRYGVRFMEYDVRFTVSGETLTVFEVARV